MCHGGMGYVFQRDCSFNMVLHALTLLLLGLLITDVDVAMAATADSLLRSFLLPSFLKLLQVLDVHGDGLVSQADGVNRVLDHVELAAADRVLL